MYRTIIDANEFLRGESSSDWFQDGGFSPADRGGANLAAKSSLYADKKGLLVPPPLLTDNAGAVYDCVCWLTHAGTFSGAARMVGSGSGSDGYFYTLHADTGVGTAVGSADNSVDYSPEYSDGCYFTPDNSFYVASKTNIAKVSIDMATVDPDWWTTAPAGGAGGDALTSGVPHPMVVFDGVMYVGNDNYLKAWNGATHNDTAFNAGAEYVITALTVYNNRIWIAAVPYDGAGSYRTGCKLFVWNGSDTKYEAEYNIADRVYSFANFQNSLYVFTKDYFGLWNGLTIQSLRDLVTTGGVYRREITQFRDILLFADGSDIIAYRNGVFWSPLKAGSSIDGLLCINGNNLIVQYNDKTAYALIDSSSTYGTGAYWRSNRYSFPKLAILRRVVVELGEPLASGSVINLTAYGSDVNNVLGSSGYTIGSLTFAADGAILVKEIKGLDLRTNWLQLRVEWNAVPKAIKRIAFYYDLTDQPHPIKY